jgi:hypothetical protein
MEHCMADQECKGMVALEADVALGWLEYDPVAAQQCHEEFSSDPCGFGDFLFVPSVYGVLNACGDVLTGQQGIGAPCASDADCAPAGRCEPEGECPGTCEQWPQEGDDCTEYAFSGDDCDPSLDLACYLDTCTVPVLVGESCTAPMTACALSLCDGTVCQYEASLGETCLVDDECASDACDGVCVDDYGCVVD